MTTDYARLQHELADMELTPMGTAKREVPPARPRVTNATLTPPGAAVLDVEVDVLGSDYAYYELMKELWVAQETFVVVEHDVVPEDALSQELWGCPEDYCSPTLVGLPCVKFGARLLQRWPGLFDDMGPVPWGVLDSRLIAALAARGLSQRHRHHGRVWHGGGGRL